MSKVRVYEVARQLGINNRELVALFQSLGFSEVRNHMSAVETEAVERVKRKLERQQAPDVVEERIAPTVVKRRSRRAPTRSRAAAAQESAPDGATVAAAPSAAGEQGPEAATASEPSAAATPTAPISAPSAAAAPPSASEQATADTSAEAPPPPPPPASEPATVEASASAAEPTEQPSAAAEGATPTGTEPAPAAAPTDRAESATSTPAPAAGQAAPPADTAEPAASAPVPPAAQELAPQISTQPRRPSAPPKSGIEVWGGRPGVPMPQRPRSSGPSARRTTYDPRANVPNRRPGYGYAPGRTIPGRPMRPGFRRGMPGQHRFAGPRGKPEVSTKEMSAHKMVIKIEGEASLQNLAAKMSLKVTDVLMKLLSMGVTGVNINSTLDIDTAKIVANEFGWTVEDVSIDEESKLEAAIEADAGTTGEAVSRPPIVTVMGHVDHGKTTLLDTVRNTTVADGEAGGITQHIGAYRVDTPKGTIAFLDTPGHEAFTAMRLRGATVTDIVLLIVAADDGVMPQTKEAIHHARSAKVPIIVVVNKIDKPGVDVERIMRDLAAEGLQPEDWGGDTIFCKVSAKTGEGVEALLEMVLLQAEMLELNAHPERRAMGVVVEALLDRGRGPVARVLVQDGTLRRGDILLAGRAHGKIRAMVDEKGRKLAEAGPATPVEVLGLNEVPEAGDPAHSVKDIKAAETIAVERKKKVSKSALAQDSRVSLEALKSRLAEEEQLELNVIIKADVQGSAEALSQALTKLSSDKVKLGLVHGGVGGITETDVHLAAAAAAIIIGFNVRPAGKAKKLAQAEGVEIRSYSVIYEAIDDVRAAMEGLLPATEVEKELGRAEVRQVFRISKVGSVAGCMVVDGLVKRASHGRLVRDSVVVWTGVISSVRRFKDDVKEVKEGMECGISLEGYQDVKEGDHIECFEIEQVKATL